MLETKEQKKYFWTIVLLVVILVSISFWNRPKVIFTGNENTGKPNQDYLNSQAYLDYLKSINIDQKASQELFQTIITKDEIKTEVEDALNVKQNITPISLDANKIKVNSVSTKQTVENYLSVSINKVNNFSNSSTNSVSQPFDLSAQDKAVFKIKVEKLVNDLYSVSVPKDALNLHKSLISSYISYSNLLDSMSSYDSADLEQNNSIWPKVYKDYVIANDNYNTYSNELDKVAAKYKIAYVQVRNDYAQNDQKVSVGEFFIPKAQAFLGLGDFTITIGDIPRIIMDAVKEGLRTAFLKFMSAMLNKLVVKIEQNYMIANFLYYTDALVSGQYVNDYLHKYVSDNIDREIVKRFIPQFNCGKNPDNLKSVFKAKAQAYLGFDPSTVKLDDPNYYEKMAKVGDFMASENGWRLYYQDLAAQAESAAQRSAEQELTSSGLKTPRNSTESTISASVNSIVRAEEASFIGMIQLGISNADSIISGIVAKLTENLMNQFVFQGVSVNGNVAVFKEQPTCVSTAVLNPVLPMASGSYETPPPVDEVQITLESEINQCMSNWDGLDNADAQNCKTKFDKLQENCSKTVQAGICDTVKNFLAGLKKSGEQCRKSAECQSVSCNISIGICK